MTALTLVAGAIRPAFVLFVLSDFWRLAILPIKRSVEAFPDLPTIKSRRRGAPAAATELARITYP